jgi:hypothetical protein
MTHREHLFAPEDYLPSINLSYLPFFPFERLETLR